VETDRELTAGFEAHRGHLRSLALRMLGSSAEADDAVQEAWLRLNGNDPARIDNLGGWLTTVVARISLDMLRARRTAAEPAGDTGVEELRDAHPSPDEDALVADSVSAAMLVVLETLAPAERLVFVLHESFAVPYDQIATILGRSPKATKQLAYRARLKVQGGSDSPEIDPARQRHVVEAFLIASREGRFDDLIALLHPDATLIADQTAVTMGSPARRDGADEVAATFSGRAGGARPAMIDGATGFVWAVDGGTRVAWDVAVVDGRIVHIEMLAAPETLAGLDIRLLDP
jgi:RNA polymerase sigma factor (sigma-70 family)